MTNLEVIKYLATNNPARLAELLEDIYCTAWNDGANDKFGDESAIPNFDKWIYEDAAKSGFHYHYELEEWSKAINPTPTLVAFYGTESKVIEQAIDEIKLLENIFACDNYPDSVCISFRKDMCIGCPDADYCPQSKMTIVECPKFENYYENYKENENE